MIPYTQHSLDQADHDAVLRVLQSSRLTQGPEVERFEEAFARKVGAPQAVSFSSGTAALHAAAYVAGVREGTEIVTSALTFVASANAGRYLGARPRFADIDPQTFNITADSAGERLSGRTAAVVPVHFAGLPAPIREIRERVGNIPVIEDACHALGSPGVGSCEHSDFCCFSFHPAKAITSGEGGMVTTKSEEHARRLRRFRNHGFKMLAGHERDQVELGYNYRLSDIHAALGRSQLAKLDRFIERRRRIASRYFRNLRGVVLPASSPGHSWHLFVIGHPERDRIYEALLERGIQTQVHYKPLPANTFYRGEVPPNTKAYFAKCLSLPLYPGLGVNEQDQVIEAVCDVV